jgi:hypothetical protein
MAQRGNGFQCHVAASLNRPFVVLFQKDRAHEAEDGAFIGKDPHDIRSPLDLSIETFDRIGGVDLRPVVFREGGVEALSIKLSSTMRWRPTDLQIETESALTAVFETVRPAALLLPYDEGSAVSMAAAMTASVLRIPTLGYARTRGFCCFS